MSIKVNVPGMASTEYDGDNNVFEVNGNTVGGCLEHLVKLFPNMKQRLFQRSGNLCSEVLIFVNEEILYPKDLDTPIRDGDELLLLFAFFGG